MSKRNPKKEGRNFLKDRMKKLLHEKFEKGAEEKGAKKLMKATIIAEDHEGLGQGAKTLAEMMLDKYRSENDDDNDDE